MTVAELARVVEVLSSDEVRVLLALFGAGGHLSVLSIPHAFQGVVRGMMGARVPLIEWRKSGTELWLTAAGCEVVTVWRRDGQTSFAL